MGIVNCTSCIISVVTTTQATTTTTQGTEKIVAIAVGAIVGGILGGIAAVCIIFVAILGYKEYTKIKIKNTSVSPDGMKSPEYLQQAEKKSKFRKLVEKMTGTTD